ncbi:MAG: DUF1553 domain-containing protein, partial [Bryobacteraceae bacterium]|nr:DUF1553 domain-containing protein [Bryobacteraceae bacterium]
PEQHTAQRHLTTVPQQALFLLNSTFAGEQARLLAARAGRDVTLLYRLALQRDPDARELELADRFLAALRPEAEAQTPPGVWSYGWGSPAAFNPFRYFSDETWQASSLPPDREAGAAKLTASGGIPGDDTAHAVIRRWTSPIDGAIEIRATLSQPFGPYEQRFHLSNGIRGRIVSSRQGVLGEWSIDPPKVEKFTNNETVKVETNLSLAVARGEIIDFIVDSRDDYESDSFTWAPVIRGGGQTWDARTDFAGPATRPLNSWEQLAQVLLLTNELMYVD